MSITCDESGAFTYKAVIDPGTDELLTDDNEVRARTTVRDAKIRVLLISGDSGWEFQYLRNFLLRDPDRYLVSVWQQNADLRFNQQASTGMRLTSLPRTMEELVEKFDVVLLYDPAYTVGGFDPTFAELLNEFVATHRGGLAYIASNKHTGENLTSGTFEELTNMLPVTVGRGLVGVAARIGRDTRAGWPIRLTGPGADHPIMQMDRDAERNLIVWRMLPGIFWSHPVRRVKPAAITLAISSDPTERADDGEVLPVVVSQMYGRGPVLYVGFDSTWRWRYVSEGSYFRRFWSNAIDYLGSYRLMKRRVILTSAGDSFTVGERMRITAEVYDAEYRPLVADSYPVRLVNTRTGAEQLVTLTPAGSGKSGDGPSGRFRRSIRLTAPGEFELTVADGTEADQVAGKVVTVALPREEFARPEANPQTLRLLAGADDALTAEQFDDLAKRIDPDRRRIVRQTSHDLWNVWGVMLLLWVLLMVEWIGRKKYNMT